jgi:hypothetical protein
MSYTKLNKLQSFLLLNHDYYHKHKLHTDRESQKENLRCQLQCRTVERQPTYTTARTSSCREETWRQRAQIELLSHQGKKDYVLIEGITLDIAIYIYKLRSHVRLEHGIDNSGYFNDKGGIEDDFLYRL